MIFSSVPASNYSFTYSSISFFEYFHRSRTSGAERDEMMEEER